MTISIGLSAGRSLACATLIAAAAGAQAFVSSAAAADRLEQPRPAAVTGAQWTGFYLGVHGGAGWGNSRVDDPTFRLTFDPVDVKSSGPIAGGQAGFNWQLGNFVVGAEIDASWASVHGDGLPGPDFPVSGFSTRFRALATGTARLGYAAGSWLGYAKAGVAWADLEFQSLTRRDPEQGGAIVIDHQRTGITAGAGLEVALYGNLSAKIEYDVLYFGSTAMALGSPAGNSNVEHLVHLAKAGLNLRFGGDTVVARY
jgi:outer membrane immunogenic protein